MGISMRAKVRVTGATKHSDTYEALTFSFPSKDGAYPADGSDEDQQFSRWTPSGSLSISVTNPNLIGRFKVGDTFYLDFVPVD